MIRTQIQLDEDLYVNLKRRASESGISMSAALRDILRREFRSKGKKKSLKDFTFVASGSSDEGDLSPISERHDEALAEDFLN
jgi:plasmid stability protein